MPTIFFYGPKMDKEKKKEMIKSFTETASNLTCIDRSAFVVYLQDPVQKMSAWEECFWKNIE